MQGIFFSGKFLLPARIEPLVPRYTALSFRATEATTAKNNVSNKGLKFPKSFIYIYLFMLKHVSSTKFLGPCRNLPIDAIKFCYFGSAILTFWPNFFWKIFKTRDPNQTLPFVMALKKKAGYSRVQIVGVQ